VFEVCNFGFKLAYSAQGRRILRLGGKHFPLKVDKHIGKFGNFGRYYRIFFEYSDRLDDIKRSLDTGQSSCKRVDHDRTLPVEPLPISRQASAPVEFDPHNRARIDDRGAGKLRVFTPDKPP
jgi:hypothetical protein